MIEIASLALAFTDEFPLFFPKINTSIKSITRDIRNQNELLLKNSNALLDVQRRTLYLLETEHNRRSLERSIKHLIFEVEQEIQWTDNIPTTLGKYLHTKGLYEILSKDELSYESLEDIGDKKFFTETLRRLSDTNQELLGKISAEEYAVLVDIRNLESDIDLYKDLYNKLIISSKEYHRVRALSFGSKEFSSNPSELPLGEKIYKEAILLGITILLFSSVDNDIVRYFLFLISALYFGRRAWKRIDWEAKERKDDAVRKREHDVRELINGIKKIDPAFKTGAGSGKLYEQYIKDKTDKIRENLKPHIFTPTSKKV